MAKIQMLEGTINSLKNENSKIEMARSLVSDKKYILKTQVSKL